MSATPAATESLAAANPDRHFLRKRLRGIALLYAVGVVLALGIGPCMSQVGNLLGRLKLRPHYTPEMYALLARCDVVGHTGTAGAANGAVLDQLAAQFPEGVVSLLLQAAHDGLFDHPRSEHYFYRSDFGEPGSDDAITLSGATLQALRARVDPARALPTVRAALRAGDLPQRTLVLDLLAAHPGPATAPLLREACDDPVAHLADRARRLLAAASSGR